MGISLSDKQILIVEDQEGVRKALRVILGPLYCVDSAKTACEALKIIIECPIDLVIMDVGLPDYDGIELLRRVRMNGSDVKVIMMSGGGNIESAKEALQLGAMAYLLKPFNFSELLTLVEDGLTAEHAEPVSGVAMNVRSISPG
jgi:DNA-binding NtrC family response regulator